MRSCFVIPIVVLLLVSCQAKQPSGQPHDVGSKGKKSSMELGSFSVSIAVKDLATSRAFYENLGFEVWGGDASQNWLILRNGSTTIGLFQGMFESNLMTFNPGWSSEAENLEEFTDIRVIQRHLKDKGVVLLTEVDETTTGPASLMLTDPDGNVILLDQHR